MLKFMFYPITSIFALSTLLAGCNFASQNEATHPSAPRSVKLLLIDQSPSSQQRRFPGKVYASQQADLAFRINGELIQLDLVEGQSVTQGDILAELDKRDAINALLNAKANFELAEVDFKRKQTLLDRKLISASDVDSASAILKSAEASLRASKDQLAYTTLYAPFSGVIAKVHTDNYQMIPSNQTIITLQNIDTFDLKIQLPESVLLDLKNAMPLEDIKAFAQFDSLGERFLLRYKEHSSLAAEGTQTYEMTFTLTAPEHMHLLPGMSTTVSIDMIPDSSHYPSMALLPLSALVKTGQDFTDKGEHDAFVWVYQPETQTLKLTPISLGNLRAEGVEILSGLEGGEQVVVNGVNSLTGKELVKPLTWARGV
ncbi:MULTISPECIES: efflux RND transporter periplasmic adaptor subunit [Vibrio]|uniref:efflux RND transporter periplasmic adaptor subunit n=1 Tax=Vibrio TaxID=662 RepID=UPI000C16DF30|nr:MULTISPECIES: efflux RND transporter periplasmic adaptor subunit [Vibrio]NNN43375.1 efflux RND transporter periplasmic adaptor subunit [Vibrio sp. 1-1(7)]NNN71199.1 efflux RND transporter periplasmic adaptor subunit [Vibrio sp. 12-2(3-a)]